MQKTKQKQSDHKTRNLVTESEMLNYSLTSTDITAVCLTNISKQHKKLKH